MHDMDVTRAFNIYIPPNTNWDEKAEIISLKTNLEETDKKHKKLAMNKD